MKIYKKTFCGICEKSVLKFTKNVTSRIYEKFSHSTEIYKKHNYTRISKCPGFCNSGICKRNRMVFAKERPNLTRVI